MLSLAPSSAAAVTLHVAVNGNDAWSGKLATPNADNSDGPLATLAGARDAIRRLKNPREAVAVKVADGVYSLKETLVFEPQDSGTADAPIIYEAADRAHPVFTGGRKIQGFVKDAGNRGGKGDSPIFADTKIGTVPWKVHLPDVEVGRWYFEDLYVNGRRAIRARSPNEFYYYARGAAGPVVNAANGKTETLPNRAFVADPKDFAPLAGLHEESAQRRGGRGLFLLGKLGLADRLRRREEPARSCLPATPPSRCWVAGRVSDTTSRTSRRLSTRPASGSSTAAAICSIFPCPAKT